MTRSFKTCAVVLPLIAALGSPLGAEVKTREKTLLKLEGMLGRMVGMFGGKAARDGIVSTSAVKGDRKMTVTDNSGQLVDLNEEKVYEIDFKKKEYKVTTFDELRERMKEAAERAEKEAERTEQQEAGRDAQEAAKELEVDFDAKETGERKQIAGHDARQVIMTVTVREKGKTVEEGGGFVMTNDAWLGPELPALQELAEFDRRYYTKLHGEAAMALAADQMAMVHGDVSDAEEGLGPPGAGGGQAQGHAARLDDDVRSGEVEAAARGGLRAEGIGRRRPRRHARAQDDEEGRAQGARDDLHRAARVPGRIEQRRRDGPRDPCGLQAEEVAAGASSRRGR